MLSSGAARPWLPAPATVEPMRFRRMPLLAATLAFASGEVLARQWHPPASLIAGTLRLFAVALIAIRLSPRVALLATLSAWIALGCWCAQIQPPISRQAELAPYADGLTRTVRGSVLRVRRLQQPSHADAPQQDEPQPNDDSPEATEAAAVISVDLALREMEAITPDAAIMQPVHGGLRLTISGDAPTLRCGDELELTLRLRAPEVYRDDGAFSYADALRNDGIGLLSSTSAAAVRTTGRSPAGWRCRLYTAQAWSSARLQAFLASSANRHLPPFARLTARDAAMLDAMLFGDRTGLTHSIRVGFERTGTFHLFVVSGLHVALLATGLYWFLRRLRARRVPALAVTFSITLAYTLLTGFGVPAQRALWMTACVLAARALHRRAVPLNALGFAGIVVLALDPRALFESSFQMTFLVLVAIAGLAAPLDERWFSRFARSLDHLEQLRFDAFLPAHEAQRRVRLRMACSLVADLLSPRLRPLLAWLLRAAVRLLELLLFGLVTEACMTLPMAVYFHRATLLALPANVFVLPLVAALLGLAVLFFLCLLVSPWLALLPAAAVACCLHLLSWPLQWINHLAVADLRVAEPNRLALIAACALLACACWSVRRSQRTATAAGLVAMLAAPLLVLWPSSPALHPQALEITAIDVGQGDSVLVVSPGGHTMLVDGGGPSGFAAVVQEHIRPSDRWDIGEDVIAPYLWSRHIAHLDAVVITHAHSDHIGGLSAVLRDFHPYELWLSVEPTEAPGLQALLAQARAQRMVIRHLAAPGRMPWHDLTIAVLAPEKSYTPQPRPTNDDSLVLRVEWKQASALLEGDAEGPSEDAMLAHGRLQASTFLKVGHHGSRTSTTPGFLAAVHPQQAIISVGKNNTFGHPRGEVLSELEAAHVPAFRTDRVGASTFLLSADGHITASPSTSR